MSEVEEAMKRSVVSAKAKSQNSLTGMTQGEVATYLSGMTDRISKVLPKHLTAERVIQMAATTIQKNPEIAKCTPASLLGAVMQASILGFPPVDSMGYCYFVPYKTQVQFQMGYLGMIELARRSGQVKQIFAEVVREGDVFEWEMGLYPKLVHKPSCDISKPMTYVYAVAHYTNGGYNFVVLSRSEVEKLRMASPMQKGNPTGAWYAWYEEMAKAKAIKRLAKYMPMNIDQKADLASDEAIITPDNFDKGQYKAEEAEYEVVDENPIETENEIKEAQDGNGKLFD